MIYDGDGTHLSTNGTWLLVDKSYDIEDGTIFKAAEVLFKTYIQED